MSEKLIRALTTAADGAFITDENQRVIFWNQAAERILDFTSHDVIHQPCSEFLAGQDNRGRLICRRSCRVTVSALSGDAVPSYDTLVRTRSNGTRWVNMSILACRVDGKPANTMVVHLFRDVTQEKQNEQLLHQVLRAAKDLEDTALPHEVPASSMEGPGKNLTTREREVLYLLAQGAQTGDIAQSLTISPSTVRNHIRNILQKLDVHSRLEAVACAFRNGLVPREHGSEFDPEERPK